ncbi:hypothetical protein ZWY2020_039440 [Hordeum vulgare]|nr:hypothetical protein ZWY2020_039440 [Hordeum vulgare]
MATKEAISEDLHQLSPRPSDAPAGTKSGGSFGSPGLDPDGAAAPAARTAASRSLMRRGRTFDALDRATVQATRQAKGGATVLPVNKTKAASKPIHRDWTMHPGGRFWVLVDDAEDEDEREQASADSPELPMPSSMAVARNGDTFCSIKTNTPKKARHRILRTAADYHEITRRRMTGASAIRPWHGPIPKVSPQERTWVPATRAGQSSSCAAASGDEAGDGRWRSLAATPKGAARAGCEYWTGLQHKDDAGELRSGAELVRTNTMQLMKLCEIARQGIAGG